MSILFFPFRSPLLASSHSSGDPSQLVLGPPPSYSLPRYSASSPFDYSSFSSFPLHDSDPLSLLDSCYLSALKMKVSDRGRKGRNCSREDFFLLRFLLKSFIFPSFFDFSQSLSIGLANCDTRLVIPNTSVKYPCRHPWRIFSLMF